MTEGCEPFLAGYVGGSGGGGGGGETTGEELFYVPYAGVLLCLGVEICEWGWASSYIIIIAKINIDSGIATSYMTVTADININNGVCN